MKQFKVEIAIYWMECAAIDTLVKLTKGNIDASPSTIFPAQIGTQGSSY